MIDRIDEKEHFMRDRRCEMGEEGGQMRAAESKKVLFRRRKEGYRRVVKEMNA